MKTVFRLLEPSVRLPEPVFRVGFQLALKKTAPGWGREFSSGM